MQKLVDNWARWFLGCAAIGSVPGAVCWILYYTLGGFASVS